MFKKLINPKIFVKYFSIVLLIFISYHGLMWNLFTYQIFTPKDGTCIGDMGRMSYQIDLLHNRELKYTLPKQHLYNGNYKSQKVEILTVGDSFSNGGGAGSNPYYQDHLASELNMSVLNLVPYPPYNSLETVIGLYNSGYLAKLKPKAIIVESVERIAPHRYSKKLDFNISDVQAVPGAKYLELNYVPASMVTTANYKIPKYMFMYNFKDNAKKEVHRMSLNKDLFSVGNKEVLIFRDDIKNLNQFTQQNVAQINKNMNEVAKMLKKLNIKLFFMPAADKYDLYYDYITNNKYPKNQFFDLIRPMKKDYYLIDTKKILAPLLKSGVKDVYWIDDTHWSSKASSAVSKDSIFDVLKN